VTQEINKSDLRAPDYLGHLLQSSDRIMQYTSGLARGQFLENSMVQDAVLRNIEILGEATRNLLECLPNLLAIYPQVPWMDIYAMRNRVAHGYFFINLELVWTVAVVDIPELRRKSRKCSMNCKPRIRGKLTTGRRTGRSLPAGWRKLAPPGEESPNSAGQCAG